MTVHELKTWPAYFGAVRDGAKPFEVRKNDRQFDVDDVLVLREFDPLAGYSGERLTVLVTYVLRDFRGLQSGYVVLGIRSLPPSAVSTGGVQ